MSISNEEKIVFNLKRIALILTVSSGLTLAVTTGFGSLWTHFLRSKVDERINAKVGDRLELLLDVVYEMNPEAYQKALRQRQVTHEGGM